MPLNGQLFAIVILPIGSLVLALLLPPLSEKSTTRVFCHISFAHSALVTFAIPSSSTSSTELHGRGEILTT